MCSSRTLSSSTRIEALDIFLDLRFGYFWNLLRDKMGLNDKSLTGDDVLNLF